MSLMNILITALILTALAGLWVFYDGFTKRGAIPLAKAWRDFTSWLSVVGIVLAEWVVELLRYLADLWGPVQAQFGTLLAEPSLAAFVQLASFVFMALKLKGQAPFPRPSFPDLPAA